MLHAQYTLKRPIKIKIILVLININIAKYFYNQHKKLILYYYINYIIPLLNYIPQTNSDKFQADFLNTRSKLFIGGTGIFFFVYCFIYDIYFSKIIKFQFSLKGYG